MRFHRSGHGKGAGNMAVSRLAGAGLCPVAAKSCVEVES